MLSVSIVHPFIFLNNVVGTLPMSESSYMSLRGGWSAQGQQIEGEYGSANLEGYLNLKVRSGPKNKIDLHHFIQGGLP